MISRIGFSPVYKLTVSLLAILLFTTCKVDDAQNIEDRNWNLTWSDEFDGLAGTTPDPTKWTYDLGRGNNGWGNQELQSYTDQPENVSLDGEGNLVITALRENVGSQITSARVKTQGLFDQTYGRFEARIKTPFGPGLWPAFWLLGSNIETVSWPQCGEIDVMELRGQKPEEIAGSLHGPGYSAGNAVTKNFVLENSRFNNEFHVFAIEWGEDFIDYFVDDFLYHRISPEDVSGQWVFNQPFFMLLNVAVGGTYVGFPTDETSFPQTMKIDYVRVYEQQ